MRRIGFIVNPYSGIGGILGLKGSDGIREIIGVGEPRYLRGVVRAEEFIGYLASVDLPDEVRFVVPRGFMGSFILESSGIEYIALDYPGHEPTISMDTVISVSMLYREGVEAIVFVGGDGTARDIYTGLRHYGDLSLPVLGVPSGVKVFSGVFAVRPLEAARLLSMFLRGEASIVDGDVVDVDEYSYRRDVLNIRLYGSLRVIYGSGLVQGSKDVSVSGGDGDKEAIARYVVEELMGDGIYILGPGSTVKAVADKLGVEKTLLGVDVYSRDFYMRDVSEQDLWRIVNRYRDVYIILSPIGRQGFILGRGNLQISPRVLRRVGRDNLIILASRRKLGSLDGGVLRIDTGDPELDRELRGYYRVVVGYREFRFVRAI